ncbi:MAG TPA: hypothetical protein VHM02_10840, partial [Thermoanaerobaculia bacterium]|nr:hypothetical protein [Thermoanaerobaculia bacterium]
MTDAELVAKKLAQIETYVRELRDLARPERLEHDLREQRFVLHTLQLAVQATLDTASHRDPSDGASHPRPLRQHRQERRHHLRIELPPRLPAELVRRFRRRAPRTV